MHLLIDALALMFPKHATRTRRRHPCQRQPFSMILAFTAAVSASNSGSSSTASVARQQHRSGSGGSSNKNEPKHRKQENQTATKKQRRITEGIYTPRRMCNSMNGTPSGEITTTSNERIKHASPTTYGTKQTTSHHRQRSPPHYKPQSSCIYSHLRFLEVSDLPSICRENA